MCGYEPAELVRGAKVLWSRCTGAYRAGPHRIPAAVFDRLDGGELAVMGGEAFTMFRVYGSRNEALQALAQALQGGE